jgi:hypothetical protein
VRIAFVLLVVAVVVYLVVRRLQRRPGRGTDEVAPPPRSQPDPRAEEAYRRAVRERAERQRRGVAEPEPRPEAPPTITFDDGVFQCNDSTDSMAEYFVVISPAPTRSVVAAVRRASERFMLVDEDGHEHADEDAAAAVRADLYTPNYVAEPKVTPDGVSGYVDCKGVIPEEMGATFRRIMREELESLGARALVRMLDD